MKRIVVLGAGFGGLEFSTTVSEALGEEVEITLIDRNESFAFGFSKLDVMFGRIPPEAPWMAYADFDKPGVTFRRETVTAIDPEGRVVTTDSGAHEADVLAVAMGADYDMEATPGLADGDNEFYSFAGAERLAPVIDGFAGGRVLVGVCGTPFKCPPAPSEACLLMHDHLVERGLREVSEITFTIPFGTPVPPSPDTSEALVDAFAERDIEFVPNARVASLDTNRKVAVYDDGSERAYDLFLGVPKHRAPDVVLASGMAVDGYIPVDSRTLRTDWEDVYAFGDCATVGVPKAGVFAEGAARVAAEEVIAEIRAAGDPDGYAGRGSCYIEFGSGRVGRVDVDFLGGPKPTGTYQEPSAALVTEKEEFGSSRRARWFGR